MDIAYESFVHDICMEAASKEAISAQKKIIRDTDKETDLSKNLRVMKTELQTTIKKGDAKQAIKIVEDCAKSCRAYVPLMSQRIGDMKKIHGTIGGAIRNELDTAKKSLKSGFVKGAVMMLNHNTDKDLVGYMKFYIKFIEHIEKYWCPLILEELRTNGCSERAFAMATQFYADNNGKGKFRG